MSDERSDALYLEHISERIRRIEAMGEDMEE